MIKKIITLALTFAIVISCFVPSAFADDTPSVGEVVDDIVSGTIASALLSEAFTAVGTGAGIYFGFPAVGTFVGGIVGEGIQNLADYYAAGYTDQDIYDQFDDYNAQLETDLGTATLIDGGARFFFSPRFVASPNSSRGYFSSIGLSGNSVSGIYQFDSSTAYWPSYDISYVNYEPLLLPFTVEKATLGFSADNCDVTNVTLYMLSAASGSECFPVNRGNSSNSVSSGSVIAGSFVSTYYDKCVTVKPRRLADGDKGPTAFTYSFSCWADLVPASGTLPTGLDITPISRPTTLTSPVAVRNDDNTYTVYNQNVVNETDNIFFNPITNDTIPFVDWSFDYATRTYTLTLEDGFIVTVIYGDDCMTIIQGDQEYTVYYVIPSEEDPGADPDDPGTDDGSGWAWLKGAWTEMMDKLSGILEAITGLELSPEINVDVEINGEEQVTQESWFSDFLTKFGFVTSVHSIYSQLIADVTSDAATAAAVADGEVMLADVTSGHAAIDGRASYTAPELAISFGSSDKYGVDWAGIRPLNLSWYAPHKETVDGILSGILWLSYLFLLIKRAPGIIRGSEMVTEDSIKIDNWRMRH